jgi:hypothetical protein
VALLRQCSALRVKRWLEILALAIKIPRGNITSTTSRVVMADGRIDGTGEAASSPDGDGTPTIDEVIAAHCRACVHSGRLVCKAHHEMRADAESDANNEWLA